MIYFWHGGIFMIPEMSSFSHKKEKLQVTAYCRVSTKHTEQLESGAYCIWKDLSPEVLSADHAIVKKGELYQRRRQGMCRCPPNRSCLNIAAAVGEIGALNAVQQNSCGDEAHLTAGNVHGGKLGFRHSRFRGIVKPHYHHIRGNLQPHVFQGFH